MSVRRKNAIFTEPVLVADVEYRTWTDGGKLRRPSLKGIRERADGVQIFDLSAG
ncbi:hypothetical protein [Ensifer aridi]|uniref:ATP dependent DNA ligase n=1 Tax=Ensifer aridi TaxID=1708715 RepID=UPI003084656A